MLDTKIPTWIYVAFKSTRQATLEFLYIGVLALMPLWLGVLVKLITSADPFTYLNGYLLNGEALLLCSSLIGPLIYTIMTDDKDASGNINPFPSRSLIFLLIIVVCIISAVVFALGNQNTSSPTGLDPSAVWIVSTVVTLLSLCIWYTVAVVRIIREAGAPAIMRQGTSDFLKEYQGANDE